MTQPLENITVAIAEHRYTKEFAALFERQGAKVYACPMLEEKPVENREELRAFVSKAAAGNLDVMIFLTGVGARFLISEADSIGLKDEFLRALEKLTIVVRGPKPVAALRQFGVRVDVTPDVPTTEGIIETLRPRDLRGKRIGVQLYGIPNPQLVSALESQGATVIPVEVYDYGALADPSSVKDLIAKIAIRDIQVLAFTSAPQVRILFDMASQLGLSDELQRALKNGVIVASIGDVTNRALAENGVIAKIVPKHPKMGAMAQAVAEFFGEMGNMGSDP